MYQDLCNNLHTNTILQGGTQSSISSPTSFVSAELTIDNICLPIKQKTCGEQKLYMG